MPEPCIRDLHITHSIFQLLWTALSINIIHLYIAPANSMNYVFVMASAWDLLMNASLNAKPLLGLAFSLQAVLGHFSKWLSLGVSQSLTIFLYRYLNLFWLKNIYKCTTDNSCLKNMIPFQGQSVVLDDEKSTKKSRKSYLNIIRNKVQLCGVVKCLWPFLYFHKFASQ